MLYERGISISMPEITILPQLLRIKHPFRERSCGLVNVNAVDAEHYTLISRNNI